MLLKRIHETIGNKRAGASVYLGVIIMLMAFLVVIICINVFQMYSFDVHAQLLCDTIADGSAIAGQTPLGFDETRMREAAAKIFSLNNASDGTSMNYTISVADEVVDGNFTGCKLITVTVYGQANFMYTEIIDFFNGAGNAMSKIFDVKAKSVVRAKTVTSITSVLSQSYYDNNRHLLPSVDIITTTPGNRSGTYATWLMNYYLCPEYNPIYKADEIGSPKNGHLLLDYLKHMGLYSEPYSAESLLSGNGATFFSSYELEQDIGIADIQMRANAGEVVFFVCRDSRTSAAEIYIVVPEKSELGEGKLAVAFANKTNDNYKIINYEDFVQTHQEIKFFHHA